MHEAIIIHKNTPLLFQSRTGCFKQIVKNGGMVGGREGGRGGGTNVTRGMQETDKICRRIEEEITQVQNVSKIHESSNVVFQGY